MMSDKKNDPNEKGRYWAGLIYPGDSAPDNWQELMQLSGLQILVSLCTIRTSLTSRPVN